MSSAGVVAISVERAGTPARLEEVLDAAARLFDSQGYEATSLADIGRALRMNKASIYHYVDSKKELLEKVIFRGAAHLRAASLDPQNLSMEPQEAIEKLVRTHCRILLEYPHELGTLIFQRRHISRSVVEEVERRERAYGLVLRGLLERGIDQGRFRRCDPGVVLQMILDSVNGLLRWYRPDGRMAKETVIDEVWAFIEAALVSPDANGGREQ